MSEEKKLKENIVNKINEGEIKMKPKEYFLFATVTLGIGLATAFFIAAVVINFIIFRMRVVSSYGIFPSPQPRWFMFFLREFPWFWALLSLILVSLGVYLYKQIEEKYKQNTLFVLLVALITVISFGFFMNRIGINERLQRGPQIRGIYKRFEEVPNICKRNPEFCNERAKEKIRQKLIQEVKGRNFNRIERKPLPTPY